MKKTRECGSLAGIFIGAACLLAASPFASAQRAARLQVAAGGMSLRVVTVPWFGDPAKPHQVFSGGSLLLQGVALLETGCPLVSATWDPGDGSGPQAIPVTSPRILEFAHTYVAGDFQPYTAVLSATDSCGTTASDTFRVVVLPKTLDVEANMAIDHGLWKLHSRQMPGVFGAIPTGFWTDQDRAAATASAVQAFEVNGHLNTGDVGEDPYIDDVQRGLAHLMTELSRIDAADGFGLQTHGDPDTNSNGFALIANGTTTRPIYVSGQVVDAIVASNSPGAVAVTGGPGVIGRTYRDIVQDLIDALAWSQAESEFEGGGYCNFFYNPRGGWRYGLNDQQSDNSACQWVAIGGIAAERVFGATVPAFVKSENLNHWIPNSQIFDGSSSDGQFGYTEQGCSPDLAGINTTPSGLVQLVFDEVLDGSPRFDAAVRYMVRNWATLVGNNRIYGMFAVTKAMRLAQPMPIVQMDGKLDWYRSDPAAGDSDEGLARHLVSNQLPDGSWSGFWVVGDLATSWALIILSPTIFQPGPIAVCESDAELTGVDVPIEFDGRGSFHADPNKRIETYEWDFDGDMVFDASGPVVTHAFPAIGTYLVKLRVTDDNDPPLIDEDTCPTEVVPPPICGDSNPGGPYRFAPRVDVISETCEGVAQQYVLDGSGSFDPDGMIISYGWDYTEPIGDAFTDATTPTVDVSAFYSALGPGTYNVGLRVVDSDGCVNQDFTTVQVRDQQCPLAMGLELWPPDGAFKPIDLAAVISGRTDRKGPQIRITKITQDEPTNPSGLGGACDARGLGTSVVLLRAERNAAGNGRVYQVHYRATDASGHAENGIVTVRVPVDKGGPLAIDDGQLYESAAGCP